MAALCCAVLYGPVVNASAGDLSPEVLTNLAYPVGDLLLLGLVVAILGLTGWRPGRGWILLGLGLALAALADGVYLLQTVEGTYAEGTLLETLWPASALLVGLAAWQPAERAAAVTHESLRMVLVPFAAGLTGIGLLSYDHFNRLNKVTVILGSVALLLVVVRTALLFYENQRMISRIHDEARTDPLTGLRNRRSLMDDMSAELALATPEEPRAIVLFDLDGFKEYNDAFGHPAGDGLLVRLGMRLADVVTGARPRLPPRGRRVLRAAAARRGRRRAADAGLRGGAERARRGLRRDDLARGRPGTRRGAHRHRGAAARRPAHVRPGRAGGGCRR